MKELYAISDKVEAKADEIFEGFNGMDKCSDEEAKEFCDKLDIDPENMSFGDFIMTMFADAFGISREIFAKPLLDLTQEDMDALEAIEEEIITFQRVMK